MIHDWAEEGRARVLQHFPERQLYLRSGGEVSYYVFSTRLQLIIVSAFALMAIWCVLTLANLLLGHNPLRPAAHEAKRVQAEYQRLLADAQAKENNAQLMLAEQRDRFEKMARNLEEKHQTLSQMVDIGTVKTATDLPTIEYAENRVLMAPTERDAFPRKARRSIITEDNLETGLGFDNSLRSLDVDQNAILVSAEAETLERIEINRALIESTNLAVDTVLRENTLGKGGPFLPLGQAQLSLNSNGFVPRVTTIQARIAEVDALENAVKSLPLGHPVGTETYQTSGFGTRQDPFTKRPTMHEGLDFGGSRLAPIVATADGVVSYVGRKGAYGRIVEVDHGHGFKTRYAHLHKTFVKRGQKVDKGQQIGGMGSTGRSTATHLHYEVHFQGRAYDPKSFLKAGLYVQ